MTIQLEAARAVAVVERARSLFGTPGAAPAADVALHSAAESAGGTGQNMADLSGQLVDRHASLAEKQRRDLAAAGSTDTALQSQLRSAAQATQTGARQMDTIVAQTRLIAQVAASARTPAAEVAVLKALRAQVTQAQSVVASTQQHAKQAAGQVKSLSYGTGDLPQTPADLPADTADENPQHGQDPRYWVDSSKIFSVPEGELPPYGSTQIGPGLYYPFEDSQIHLSPPPPAAKFPLDAAEITSTAPGQLGSYRDQILAEMPDGTRYWAPDPSVGDVGPSSFPAPQMPVDFRDVLHVPEGQKAPRGYHEFLPNWWIPTY